MRLKTPVHYLKAFKTAPQTVTIVQYFKTKKYFRKHLKSDDKTCETGSKMTLTYSYFANKELFLEIYMPSARNYMEIHI